MYGSETLFKEFKTSKKSMGVKSSNRVSEVPNPKPLQGMEKK